MVNKEISVDYVYEDEHVFVIKDIHPQAPTHLLAILKAHYSAIHLVPDAETIYFQHLSSAIKKVLSMLHISDNGYRLVINYGEAAGQSVPHIHVHILSGRQFDWPPG